MNTYDITGTKSDGTTVKIVVCGAPEYHVAKQIATRECDLVGLKGKKWTRADARDLIVEQNRANGHDTIVIKGY